MNIIDALAALEGQGMALLAAIADGKLTRNRLIDLGYSTSTAGKWVKLSATYYGPTRYRRQQRTAVDAATTGRMSIEAVAAVEKNARKLLDGDVWELRTTLCQLTGTVDEIDKAAAAHVRELNRAVPDADGKVHAQRSLKGGKNTDARGLRHISVGLPERTMADVLGMLRKTADKLRRGDSRLSYEQAMADSLLSHLRTGGNTASSTITPLVVIGLGDWAKLQRHEGSESIFGLTDGTTMTGAQLVKATMSEHHLVGIWDPVDGPVNLYRSQRHASTKQRQLLAADTLLCPVQDCTTSAEESQVHHLKAWKNGGNTDLENMCIACRVHNARNDDDPNAPPRNGHLGRDPITNRIVFYPPDGRKPVTNRHPLRDLSARAMTSQ